MTTEGGTRTRDAALALFHYLTSAVGRGPGKSLDSDRLFPILTHSVNESKERKTVVAAVTKRKTTIRLAADVRAALPAFGIAVGDGYGTAMEAGERTVSLVSAKFAGSLGGDDPVPVVFDLTEAAVVYPSEADAAVCELLARATAEQLRAVAVREGHSFTATDEVVRGRPVIRIVVEVPPRTLTIDLDKGGKEVTTASRGHANPREGRALAKPFEAVFR